MNTWHKLTLPGVRWGTALLGLCLLLQIPAHSEACSLSAPVSAFFPHSGEVTANLGAVLWTVPWQLQNGDIDTSHVKFVREVDNGYVDVPFTMTTEHNVYTITPTGGFIPDNTYLLWSAIQSPADGTFSPEPPSEPPLERLSGLLENAGNRYPNESQRPAGFAKFTVTEAVQLPTSLGDLTAEPTQEGIITLPGGAACMWNTNATTAVMGLDLSDPSPTWLNGAVLKVLLDGKIVSTAPVLGAPSIELSNWTDRTHFRVDRICTHPKESASDTPERSVQILATVPGTELLIKSEVATLDLPFPDCSKSHSIDGGVTEVLPSGTGGISVTGGTVTTAMDASVATGGSIDSGEVAPEANPAAGGGCSASGHVPSSPSTLPCLLALAVLWRQRQKSPGL